jgi:hypothetical protein
MGASTMGLKPLKHLECNFKAFYIFHVVKHTSVSGGVTTRTGRDESWCLPALLMNIRNGFFCSKIFTDLTIRPR